MVTTKTSKKKSTMVTPTKAKAATTKTPKASKGRTGGSPGKVLQAIKALHQRGMEAPLRKLVARQSGYEFTRSFQNILGKLKKQGFLEYPGSDSVCLTEAGMVEAGDVVAPTNKEIQNSIREKLKGKEIEFFDYLLDGEMRSTDEVKAATNCGHLQDRSFSNILSKLKGHGILDYVKNPADPKKKYVQLNDTVYPFGRPSQTAEL